MNGTVSTAGNESVAPRLTADALRPRMRDLLHTLRQRHGRLTRSGWGVRLRRRFGYFPPGVFYECVVRSLVRPDGSWLDVGAGRDLLPENRALAAELSARCGYLLGVDPDANLEENPYVHARARVPVEQFDSDRKFDLVTLHMVAEHVTAPDVLMAKLAELTRPGGAVVIYTVDRRSPSAIVSGLTPIGAHHFLKRLLWRTEERDTFPVAYQMNRPEQLTGLLSSHGFRPVFVWQLAFCHLFARFRGLHAAELLLWSALERMKVGYPETCLLAVGERLGEHVGESARNVA